ncbi:hypothetical protein DBR43_09950 [Pedobacter sp. KBW06]|uniref:phosphatase PAP2-related protein n=1 Tax=Pedobacter sp. KBW06 TaxID=2153359 RepID=UPI000F5B1D92|nr:phosphatase PAP2-related protein [Pedobacter sp. KBW06]RQO75650.1 hypothetical protein DBR43_09950 [Pedobacter sp. KBW06]
MYKPQNLWVNQWKVLSFRRMIYLGAGIMIMIAILFPLLLANIQRREGKVISDAVLGLIPAHDVSLLVFIVLYGVIGLLLVRVVKCPLTCLTMIWGYIFLCLTRAISISLVPLEPPHGIIDLKDPFSFLFYHAEVITKDLFFSGHVSTLFLIALCLPEQREKAIALIASGLMSILLLIQHVHYTMDILVAPIFSSLFWLGGRSMARIGFLPDQKIKLIQASAAFTEAKPIQTHPELEDKERELVEQQIKSFQ